MTGPPKNDVFEENSLKGTFQVDAIEQNERRDNVRFSIVTEESGGDVYKKVLDFAQKAGVAITKKNISVFQILPKTGAKSQHCRVCETSNET